MPESTQGLLLAGQPTQEPVMHADAGCTRVTTEDAGTIVRILDDAGIEPVTPGRGEYWLAYEVEDPRLPAYTIWIQFGPVLPHGEATWLGPG